MTTVQRWHCDKSSGAIKKLASAGLEGKCRGAAAMLKKYSLTNDVIGALAVQAGVDGPALATLAYALGADDEAIWKTWTK